jgi:AraC-like DNA-binding protein
MVRQDALPVVLKRPTTVDGFAFEATTPSACWRCQDTQGSLSLAEIAASAGFAHQSHMARLMRRELGLAPRVLKRLMARTSVTR